MGSYDQSLKYRGLVFVFLLIGAECVRIDANIVRSALLEEIKDNDISSTGGFWPRSAGSTVCRAKKGEDQLQRYLAKILELNHLDAALDKDADPTKCLEMAGRIDMFRKCSDPKVLSKLPLVASQVMYQQSDHPYSEDVTRQVAEMMAKLGFPQDYKLEPLDIEMQQANIKLITHLGKYLRPQFGCSVNLGGFDPAKLSQAVNPAVTLDEQLFGKNCTVASFIAQQPDSIKEKLDRMQQALHPLAEDIKAVASGQSVDAGMLEQHMHVADALTDGLEGSLALAKDFAQLIKDRKNPALKLPVISEPIAQPASVASTLQVASNLQVADTIDLQDTSNVQMAFLTVVLIICVVGLVLFLIANVIWCYTTEDTQWQSNRAGCVTSFFSNRGKRF